MRIILINRFFAPDESATALMLADLVQGLAPLGHDLHVITAAAGYTPGAVQTTPSPMPSSLTITRLPSLSVSHQSLIGRLLNLVLFSAGLVFAGLWHIRRGDIVICLTDPPLVGILAAVLTTLKRAALIHWVQDIYPETATRLGYGSSGNPLIRLVAKLRDWAWTAARTNVVIGEHMHALLQARGVQPAQLCTIANWANETELSPLDPAENPLRAAWGFANDAIVVGYSGNLGRAHDAATMLDAAAALALRQQHDIKFLFIGGGAKHAMVASATRDPRLAAMISLQPYRPRRELRESLSVPDIHWLSLEPQLEGLIVPSKFYGAAAVGRPIIFIGDCDGEIARLISQAQCGASFAKGDVHGVANYLALLASDRLLRQRLGTNARNFCTQHLAQAQRIAQWQSVITKIASKDES